MSVYGSACRKNLENPSRSLGAGKQYKFQFQVECITARSPGPSHGHQRPQFLLDRQIFVHNLQCSPASTQHTIANSHGLRCLETKARAQCEN